MNPHDDTYDLSFRVVVYRDGDFWDAHALELDIVGCGETPDEALDELIELIECQVSFAIQTGDPSLINQEAPPEIVALWETARSKAIEELFATPAERTSLAHRSNFGKGAEVEGPLAKVFGLDERKLEKLRDSPLELLPCS